MGFGIKRTRRYATGHGGMKLNTNVGVARDARRVNSGDSCVRFGVMTAAVLSPFAGGACFAQSATPGSTIALDPIVVEQKRAPAPSRKRPASPASARSASSLPDNQNEAAGASAATPDVIGKRFEVMPGGVARVPLQELSDTGNPTVSRALGNVPGVVVQNFFGGNDQPRIQIRGSGLRRIRSSAASSFFTTGCRSIARTALIPTALISGSLGIPFLALF